MQNPHRKSNSGTKKLPFTLTEWAVVKRGEFNTMDWSLFNQAELRFLICRLSTYRDVSASISHGLVAQIAQEIEGVFTDFAFLPPPKDTEVMTASKFSGRHNHEGTAVRI